MRILDVGISKSSSKQKIDISWQCGTCAKGLPHQVRTYPDQQSWQSWQSATYARVLPHQAKTSPDQLQTARLGRLCCKRRDAPSSEGSLIKSNREVDTPFNLMNPNEGQKNMHKKFIPSFVPSFGHKYAQEVQTYSWAAWEEKARAREERHRAEACQLRCEVVVPG